MSEQDNALLRNFQLKEIELLRKILVFFEENGIQYYALGGTLLGAVRHKGFIPWDDDIDLGLPREDYERLLSLHKEGQAPFDLHSSLNDQNHYRYHSRIEDSSVKVCRTYAEVPEYSSAWVDIFPLDGAPSNSLYRFFWKYYIMWRRAMFKFSCFSRGVSLKKVGRPKIERVLIRIGQLIPVEKIFVYQKEFAKTDKALKRFPYDGSNYSFLAMGGYKLKELFPKEVFGEGAFYDFEGLRLRGPKDYDAYLSQLYGEYMKLPTDAERKLWHCTEVLPEEKQ